MADAYLTTRGFQRALRAALVALEIEPNNIADEAGLRRVIVSDFMTFKTMLKAPHAMALEDFLASKKITITIQEGQITIRMLTNRVKRKVT